MLTHIDKKGNAKIVNISDKKSSKRLAVASGKILVNDEILDQIKKNETKKGDIFTVAKIAGIMAAKKTDALIPLCHQIKIDDIDIKFKINKPLNFIKVDSTIKCFEKTGAEMEALTATSLCLLTIYDMCKAVDKEMEIFDVYLTKKIGGKSDFNKKY